MTKNEGIICKGGALIFLSRKREVANRKVNKK
jgi:hypothetical protein